MILFVSFWVLSNSLHGQEKTTLAILDLEALNVAKSEAEAITDRVHHELFKTKRYTLLERGQVSEILKEQGFQQSGCTTSECYVQAGRMLGVQKMVGGSISKVGNLYTINLKIMDVETGAIEASAAADLEGNIEQVMVDLCNKAVSQLIFGEKPPKKHTYLYVGGAALVVGAGVAVYLIAQPPEKETGTIVIQVPQNP
jgi:hypothetical protein